MPKGKSTSAARPPWWARRRFWIWALVVLLLPILTFHLFISRLNHQEERRWLALRAEIVARGEPLTLADYLGPIPQLADEDNVAKHPIFLRALANDEEFDLLRKQLDLHTDENPFGLRTFHASHDGLCFGLSLVGEHPPRNRLQAAARICRAFISAEPILRELDEALSRPHCLWGRPDESSKEVPEAIEPFLETLSELIELRLEARIAMGRWDEMVEDLDLLSRMRTRTVGNFRRPDYGQIFARFDQEALFTRILREHLRCSEWDAVGLARFEEFYRSKDYDFEEAIPELMIRDRILSLWCINNFDPQEWGLFRSPKWTRYYPAFRELHINRARADLLAITEKQFFQPYREKGRVEMADVARFHLAGWEDYPTRRSLWRGWIKFHSLAEEFARDSAASCLGLMFCQARRGQILVAIAAERHRLMHGGYPRSREEFEPSLVPSWPVDPADGSPMRFRLDENGLPRIWSVGPDKVDERGVVPKEVRLDKHATDWAWEHPQPIALPYPLKSQDAQPSTSKRFAFSRR